MTDGHPHPSVDELLDAFISAWHAGDAPRSAEFASRAPQENQGELIDLIAAFLELAPSVPPTPARSSALADDPLIARIAGLEGARWDARGEPNAVNAAPWGQRLRGLREAAGLSVGEVAHRFAERFGLASTDAECTPAALQALETGDLPSSGVAARAARALEELLAAPKGVLAAGAAPAFGGPVLRGAIPDDPGERAKFADLLREVDDALAIEASAHDDEPESLSDLLGA